MIKVISGLFNSDKLLSWQLQVGFDVLHSHSFDLN
jgi:hypothetical protein